MFGRYALPSDELVTTRQPTITVSDEDPEYPGTNLYELNPANPAKLTTTAGNIVFDFGEAVTIEAVALIYHNLTAGVGVLLEWNSSNSWGSPMGSQAITIPAWTEEPNDGAVSPWAELTGSPSAQFWRLLIDGTPGNDLDISIGNVLLMSALRDLGNDVRWGVVENEEHGLLEQETELHVEYVEALGGKRRSFVGEFALKNDTSASLISLYRSTQMRVSPWLLIPDVDVNDAWLVRFASPLWSRTRENPEHNIFPFTVKEVSRGVPWP